MKTVITFGTFDLYHVGHVKILERARALGDRLIVGVSSDELNYEKKGHYPIISLQDRMYIIASHFAVDKVFVEESLEKKRDYIQQWCADILVMGDDWEGRFDHLRDICEVVYLPRTPNVSTTEIKAKIRPL